MSMRVGMMLGADRRARTVDDIVAIAKQAEEAGLDDVWLANIRSLDAILTASIVARETSRIGVGTAVTPTFPRHPVAMAQQALTAASASAGRFTLGIGLSHKPVMEGAYGLSYARPARHMREYLDVLMPLLNGETVTYHGEVYQVNEIGIDVPNVTAPSVVVAALGPKMLSLAGSVTDGTNTWMVGPQTMEHHIIKELKRSAERAGKPTPPRVVGGFPVVVTDNADTVRASLTEGLAVYGQLPSYSAMIEREGVSSPAELALVGDEKAIRAKMDHLRDIGVTDFMAAVFDAEPGAFSRTQAFLASYSR